MDATHPIWRTPAIRNAAAEGHLGRLIRMTRLARGLTLAQAGILCHVSPSTLSRIETGKRALTNVTQLRQLSEALEIPPRLFGLTPPPPGAADRRDGNPTVRVGTDLTDKDGDEAMRRRELIAALAGTALSGFLPGTGPTEGTTAMTGRLESLLLSAYAPPAPPMPLADLEQALAAARAAFQTCRYRDLANGLPGVIAAVHASRGVAAGHDYDRLSAVLAETYLLASELAVKRNEDAIAWVAADRALTAARDSGEAATIAAGSRAVAIAMRRQGHHDAATSLLTTTALGLGTERDAPPALLAAYGSLLCTAAYSSAQNNKPAQALELITEAGQAATRLALAPIDYRRTSTIQFSTTNVALYRIGIHTALGDSGAALRHAHSISPDLLPTAERRARFYVDTARAWEKYGDRDRACQALAAAERHAPEEIRRPSVKTLISTMLYAPGPTPTGLRPLAARADAAM